MPNYTTFPNPSAKEEQLCPLLQLMKKHSYNNHTEANMAVVAIHGLVSCLGILENALILWVVGFRLRRRTVASVWVLNLAMSDFLATLTLPFFTHYMHSSHSWELGSPLCSAQASIFFLNMFVSAFLLAAISLDRCLLVSKPVWSQNHRSVAAAWKVCAVGWLWGVVNTFPYFLFRAVTEKEDGRKLCYHNFALYTSSPDVLLWNCRVRQAATAISKLLLAFVVPLTVIAGSYVLFVLSLRKRRRKRKQSAFNLMGALIATDADGAPRTPNTAKTTQAILYKQQASTPGINPTPSSVFTSGHPSPTNQGLLSRSFTKMVTSVIAAFALCWLPYHIFCLIEVSAEYRPERVVHVEVGLPLATTFAFLNPVLNPILYAFSCPHFCVRIRQSLSLVFEGLVEEGGGVPRPPGRRQNLRFRRASSRDGSVATPASLPSPGTPRPAPSSPASPSSPSLSSSRDGLKFTQTPESKQEETNGIENV